VEARSTATATFSRADESVPGSLTLFSPWNQPTVVDGQRVEGFPDQGTAAGVYPIPEDEGTL
jgi:hypothetical protein